ncbi:hypothetical protein [Streptomyces venezuelae]|uniref:hypothetical protein n=1 Tax=Streptomyces venezuelae TaxID=54571 RepID=UPI001CC247C9|nr:hypothetical protein [Streptomyces venezuelae]
MSGRLWRDRPERVHTPRRRTKPSASAASALAFTAGEGLGLLWPAAVTARLAGAPAYR